MFHLVIRFHYIISRVSFSSDLYCLSFTSISFIFLVPPLPLSSLSFPILPPFYHPGVYIGDGFLFNIWDLVVNCGIEYVVSVRSRCVVMTSIGIGDEYG